LEFSLRNNQRFEERKNQDRDSLEVFRPQRRTRAFADKRMGNHAQGLSGEKTGDFLPPDFPERSGSFAVRARTHGPDRSACFAGGPKPMPAAMASWEIHLQKSFRKEALEAKNNPSATREKTGVGRDKRS
jgi:hypothetical protein